MGGKQKVAAIKPSIKNDKKMKKIIFSLAMIAAVAAIAVGGTMAYFSDTETTTGNTFTAGTIDIDIDGENAWTSHYDIGDLKPGEVGYINFEINNVGKNPVNISKTLKTIVGTGGDANYDCNNRGVSSEPECEVEGGTAIDNIQTQIVYDLSVEVYVGGNLIWWQTIYSEEDNQSIANVYGPQGGDYVDLGMIPVGGYMLVTQSYHFSALAGNEYQGDGLTFDIEIKADQMAQEDGYTTVALENKDGAPDWNIIEDGVEGTLSYKTKGAEFVYTFTGDVNVEGNYTLLYVGPTNDYPATSSVVLGTASSASLAITISGQVATGDIINGKIWLIPTSSYVGGVMTSWPEANILFETGLINYTVN